MHTSLAAVLSLALLPLAAPLCAQDKHDLHLALKVGDKQCFQHTTVRKQTTEVRGQEIVIDTRLVHTLALAVTAVGKDGTVTADLTVVRTQGAMTVPPEGEATFDSASTGEPDEQGIGPAMCAFAGRTYTLQVARHGEVKSVQGGSEAIAAAKKTAFKMGARLLQGQIDESLLQSVAQSLFGYLPTKAVSVGGEWPQEVKTDLNGTPMVTTFHHTLSKVDKAASEIAVQGTIATPDAPKDKLHIEKGEVKGKATVAMATGLVVQAQRTSQTEMVGPSPLGDGDLVIQGRNEIQVKQIEAAAAQLPKQPAK